MDPHRHVRVQILFCEPIILDPARRSRRTLTPGLNLLLAGASNLTSPPPTCGDNPSSSGLSVPPAGAVSFASTASTIAIKEPAAPGGISHRAVALPEMGAGLRGRRSSILGSNRRPLPASIFSHTTLDTLRKMIINRKVSRRNVRVSQ